MTLFNVEGACPSGAPSGGEELLLAAVVDQLRMSAMVFLSYNAGMKAVMPALIALAAVLIIAVALDLFSLSFWAGTLCAALVFHIGYYLDHGEWWWP